MMSLKIFTVHDSKANAFLTPYFSPTTATGIRSFAEAANDPNSMFAKHPGDYTLFELGTFDVETAKIKPLKTAQNLGLAITHQQERIES